MCAVTWSNKLAWKLDLGVEIPEIWNTSISVINSASFCEPKSDTFKIIPQTALF